MKQSIKKIFGNLSTFLIFATIFAGFGVLITIDHARAYHKIDNLNNQKHIISTLTSLSKDDLELALILFNGKSTQLLNEINKLRSSYKYNFSEQYLVKNSTEYLADLDELSDLTKDFNQKARDYYIIDKKDEKKKLNLLKDAFVSLNDKIDKIIIKSVSYNKKKFELHKYVTYIAFLIILLATMVFRKSLKLIYEDLIYLYGANKTKDYKMYSEEADAISLRMNRKPVTSDNPSNLDPVTGINNNKGMMNEYASKKGMKESHFTTVTTIEIDNFSKSNRPYSQEFTQSILKKVAFTISLHEQAADVIARTDYNQFAIILSRANKEQAYKDIDIIRQSIAEIKFKSPATGAVVVTVSGGYVVKPNNVSLDESIRESKKVLAKAIEHGGNRIYQIKDLQESEYAEG